MCVYVNLYVCVYWYLCARVTCTYLCTWSYIRRLVRLYMCYMCTCSCMYYLCTCSWCTYAWICLYMCTHIRTFVFLHVGKRNCTYMCVFMSTCVSCADMWVYVRAYLYTYSCMCIVRVHIYLYCIYIRTYVYVFIYTYSCTSCIL